MSRRIGQCFVSYLPRSEVFIFQQIRFIRAFQSVMLAVTETQEASSYFPFKPTYIFRKSNQLTVTANEFNNWAQKCIKDQKILLLHAHGASAGYYFSNVAKGTGTPLIVSLMGRDVSADLADVQNRLRFILLSRASNVLLTQSDTMRQQLIQAGLGGENILTVRRGINADQFQLVTRLNSPERPIVIMYAGRFVPKKGLSTLIHAFAALVSTEKNCVLQLVGDGPLLTTLQNLVNDCGITQYVKWMEWLPQNDLVKVMAQADIFCHPSETSADSDEEGIPNVLKEAMATGLAVIATYHAGIPELVEDGISGVLVPQRDSEAVRTALTRLIHDPSMRVMLGRSARMRIEKEYDLKKNIKQLEAIYERALGH